MGLRELDLKSEYRTKHDNISRGFLIPTLSEAVTYRRSVGFFSSSALKSIAPGLGKIASRGGKIQLVASPILSEEDIAALSEGYRRKEQIVQEAFLGSMPDWDELDSADQDRYNLLANLIADDVLDFRIAITESKSGYGIYHEKLGLITDANGDTVVFDGSMNESENAFTENYEAINVFRSWNDPEGRVDMKEAAFTAIWNGYEPGITTFDFPEIKDEVVKRYKRRKADYSQTFENPDECVDVLPPVTAASAIPIIPDKYELRPYQEEAIKNWQDQGYRGIYDMATGTGKTVTALASVVRLAEYSGNYLAVIIVCPFQHLVEQWVEDLEAFNIDPIIGYSSSPQKDWKQRLADAIRDQTHQVDGSKFFCFICTNATFASQKVQKLIARIKAPKLLVVDEAHNFGAATLRSNLSEAFDYRLALSATIERFRDDEGTSALFEYFGDRCIEYTLEEAIKGRGEEDPCLTPYRYYPIKVYLEPEELEKYSDLSHKISTETRKDKRGRSYLTKKGEYLALERARLVAAAHQKLAKLKDAIDGYKDKDYMLVYCGATKVEVDDEEVPGVDDYEVRQIDAVTHILGDELDMKVRQFTSRESSAEREEIKEAFSERKLQALIAIKCLDEGVNIPMIQTAFILASTTNPREYIQRRGRLLRKDREGKKKRAEIYDFITLPRDPELAAHFTEDRIKGERRLVYNELVRAKEFASLSENRSSVMKILDDIEFAYFGLDGIESYEQRQDEEME